VTDAPRLAEDADELAGAPLPRERCRLHGHEAAERAFLEAFRAGRLHHGWLIGGPEGVGKATLGFRIARFLLARGDDRTAANLDVDPAHPAARAVAQLAHPDLAVLRRGLNKEGKLRGEITADDARDLVRLFETTSGALGWRVAIVDPADELNRHAANALLKMLEEPPPRSLFLILAHAPSRLLPTIRSRCRRLTLGPLAPETMREVLGELAPEAEEEMLAAAIARAEGSPRRALRLVEGGALGLLVEIERVLDGLPKLDLRAAHALADKLGRKGGEGDFALFREAAASWAARRARAEAPHGLGPAAALAEAQARADEAYRAADTYNLDQKAVMLQALDDFRQALERRAA
jgi:DNA polymerase-3 subunit delta'